MGGLVGMSGICPSEAAGLMEGRLHMWVSEPEIQTGGAAGSVPLVGGCATPGMGVDNPVDPATPLQHPWLLLTILDSFSALLAQEGVLW